MTFFHRIFKLKNLSFKEIQKNLEAVLYPDLSLNFKKFKLRQYTVDQTIEVIATKRLSLARFGDGEIAIMHNVSGVGFQDKDLKLAEALQKTLQSPTQNLLIGLPDQFRYIHNSVRRTRKFWIEFSKQHQKQLLRVLKPDVVYGNTNISRFYMVFKNKEKAQQRFKNLKHIWNNEDVLMVEGMMTRSGVGNDLYTNTKSFKRILCPPKNAFKFYDLILSTILKHCEKKLILLSLGPTATILAKDLADRGHWALDLGHLDVEYMWMQNKATSKIPLRGRHVNENTDGEFEDFDENELAQYQSQILVNIKFD